MTTALIENNLFLECTQKRLGKTIAYTALYKYLHSWKTPVLPSSKVKYWIDALNGCRQQFVIYAYVMYSPTGVDRVAISRMQRVNKCADNAVMSI